MIGLERIGKADIGAISRQAKLLSTKSDVLATFTFYLHDGAGTIPAFEIEPFDQDEEAIAFARRLLSKRPRYSHVEITDGDRAVASVARELGDGAA